MPKLCLNMIVKNEAHLIASTLRNLAEHTPIDYWVISDTGSTDETIQVIYETMAELGIPGELFQDSWVNFSHNRNLALEHAVGKAEHVLFFDADDYITGQVEWPEQLTADAYYMSLTSESRDIFYQRMLVVRNGFAKWRGVVHEFIETVDGCQITTLSGDYHVVSCRKGDRSRDEQKYLKDALLLRQAIETGQDPDLRPRYLFYCAQSYMDAGMTDESIYWYGERAKETAGWSEEAYVSHLRLGFAYEGRGQEDKAIHHWLLGAQLNPHRAECWYHLARVNSWKGRHELGYVFAQQAVGKTLSSSLLFATTDIYEYWSDFELFVNAYATGHLSEAYQAFKALVKANAPLHLYQERLNMVAAVAHLVQEDAYREVTQLKNLLESKGASAVLTVLGI